MKAGNSHLLDVIRFLGPDTVGYVGGLGLRLTNGTKIIAEKATVDGFMIHGKTFDDRGDFMMPAEELVAVEVNWDGKLPEGVTDIPSAIAHEKKAARK